MGAGIRAQLERACAAAGLAPHVAFKASTPVALAELAERGLGVAIVPQSVSRTHPGLSAIEMGPDRRGRLVFAWRSWVPMSPAARVLVDMARRLLR